MRIFSTLLPFLFACSGASYSSPVIPPLDGDDGGDAARELIYADVSVADAADAGLDAISMEAGDETSDAYVFDVNSFLEAATADVAVEAEPIIGCGTGTWSFRAAGHDCMTFLGACDAMTCSCAAPNSKSLGVYCSTATGYVDPLCTEDAGALYLSCP